jgi:hypothetical protein
MLATSRTADPCADAPPGGPSWLLPAAALLVLAGLGCGGSDGPTAPPKVARIVFAVARDTLMAGLSRPLTVQLLDGRGRTLTGRGVTFSTSATEVAVVDPGDSLRGVAPGLVRVEAVSEGVRASQEVLVVPLIVSRLNFPSPLLDPLSSLSIGDTLTRPATALSAGGGPLPRRVVSYSSSDPAVASVSATGLLTALTPGLATIRAQAAEVVAFYGVTVVGPPVRLRLYPERLLVAPGAAGRLAAAAYDVAGRTPRGALVFRSTNSGVMTVDAATGAVAAVGAGSAALIVSTGALSDTAAVVVEAPPASAFHVDVTTAGPVTAELLSVARQAVARWERVVVGDVPDVPLALSSDACEPGTPAFEGVVDDVTVMLQVKTIDGPRGILAGSGPCVVRDDARGLPAFGVVTFDSADVAGMLASGDAVDVMAHEIAHVLGFGAVWNVAGVRELVPRASQLVGDPQFVGAGAAAAAANAGFTGPGGSVPVETIGGPGTAGVHWRKSVFGTELMTGFESSGADPISATTVLSLRDLGYQVTETGADVAARSFSGGTTPAGVRASLAPDPARALGEVVRRPRFTVGPDGEARAVP